jgi:signal transduction histidine kinase
MGGELEVESELGVGSSFTIRLPAVGGLPARVPASDPGT